MLSQWRRWYRICLQCKRPEFDPWVRKIPWRREWQPTPVCLPGESHGLRSLVGYSPWGCKESDMNEHTLLYYYPYKHPSPCVTQALSKHARNNIPQQNIATEVVCTENWRIIWRQLMSLFVPFSLLFKNTCFLQTIIQYSYFSSALSKYSFLWLSNKKTVFIMHLAIYQSLNLYLEKL